MGLAGLVVALICGGFLMPAGYVWLIRRFQINAGVNPYLTAASLELSLVVTLLCWHHLFEDWPGTDLVASLPRRILARLAIWLGLGTAFGFTWARASRSWASSPASSPFLWYSSTSTHSSTSGRWSRVGGPES
jgi:AAT family amino acid transporter